MLVARDIEMFDSVKFPAVLASGILGLGPGFTYPNRELDPGGRPRLSVFIGLVTFDIVIPFGNACRLAEAFNLLVSNSFAVSCPGLAGEMDIDLCVLLLGLLVRLLLDTT